MNDDLPPTDRRAAEDRRADWPVVVQPLPGNRPITNWDYRCWAPRHDGDYRCWHRVHPETRHDALKRAAHAALNTAGLPDRPSQWTPAQIDLALDLAGQVAAVARIATQLAEKRASANIWTHED